jgi:hypothetical protein
VIVDRWLDLTPDEATGFDMTFELGLLECCRQHKFWVVEFLRNCYDRHPTSANKLPKSVSVSNNHKNTAYPGLNTGFVGR